MKAEYDFVKVPSGKFLMGDPDADPRSYPYWGPQNEVSITRDFMVQKTPVTQSQWQELMGYNPSRFTIDSDSAPADNVSWFEAMNYCNAMSRREGLPEAYEVWNDEGFSKGKDLQGKEAWNVEWKGLDCPGYRLLTEAEWEYAYRAGTTTPFYNAGDPETIGWHLSEFELWEQYNTGECVDPRRLECRSIDVAQKAPNAWGLFDMSGNVWEWCWDAFYYFNEKARVDPIGGAALESGYPLGARHHTGVVLHSEGSGRVLRGGSCVDPAKAGTATSRRSGLFYRDETWGVRVAQSLP